MADPTHIVIDNNLTVLRLKGAKHFSNPTVGSTTAIQVLAANTARITAVISNTSAVTFYLGKDATVTGATNQVALNPGDTLTDDASNDAWFAIAASGTANVLSVLEVY